MFDPLKSKAKVVFYSATAFLFGLGIASGLGWTGPSMAMPTLDEQPRVSEEAVAPAADLSDAFVNIATAVRPAVVRIQTERPRQVARGSRQIPEPFRRFFDQPDPDRGDQPFDAPPQIAGGTGFIVSEDGYILTNNHVVEDANEITVYTLDRKEYSAELVGTDPTTDVAVIRIDPESDLTTMSFGDSDDVAVGEWVMAVGNPGFGGASQQLDYTVTAGIVSALGRPLQIIQRELQRDPDVGPDLAAYGIENFIQTDAVINPGNSGGPLVNLQGQVIGMNTAIASRSGFYQGYGFAIPVNLARRVMEDLIEYGRVRRAWLGVSITQISSVDAEAYDLPSVSGVLVQDFPDQESPARRAGLQVEDVIWSVNGERVSSPSDLQQTVAQLRPGTTAELRVYRNGDPMTIRVDLGEAPLNQEPERTAAEPEAAEERLGFVVQELTPQAAEQLGYDEAEGVVVTRVQPGSPAWERNLPQGWRIVSMNQEPVETTEDVRRVLQDAGAGDIVTFRLENPTGGRQVVNIRIPR